MKRRKFIKKAAAATAGSIITPYILPSGRLFAQSGTRIVNHVVLVLFAGGIRNQESVEKAFISEQIGQTETGNVMENLLSGAPPNYGVIQDPFAQSGFNNWAPVLSDPVANNATLFQEMEYKEGSTGHYAGHLVAITGNYSDSGVNLNVNPEQPTIFEYYRKHSSKSAINAWWLSEGLGPYPSLNYSQHPSYGSIYGANYLRPASIFSDDFDYFQNVPSYQPDDVARIRKMRDFLNNNFDKAANELPGIQNTEEERDQIKQFILDTYDKAFNQQLDYPTENNNAFELTGDLINVTAAWEVLKTFAPELTVINTFNLDVCHSDFTSYLWYLHRADFGIGWLWDKIQSDPVLKDDTIMICVPEHGRNSAPNSLVDNNGLAAYDHTSDDNSRRIFALVAGPSGKVNQGQVVGSIGNPVGEIIDVAPTIAKILGFDADIPGGLLPGKSLDQAFV